MTSASEALAVVAREAVGGVPGLNGAYDGAPIKASLPYGQIDAGPENDWSWKDGEGREVRLAATIRDAGEQPTRLRRLMVEVEEALLGLSGAVDEWRLVNVVTVRTRTAQKRAGEWMGLIEVRVRMERVG